MRTKPLTFSEAARVLMRFDHVASQVQSDTRDDARDRPNIDEYNL